MTDLCEDVMQQDDSILATALLEGDAALSWSVREGLPEVDENRQRVMSIETSIIMTLVRKNQDYLGRLHFVVVRQEMADVLLFSIKGRPKRTFCAVVTRPYDLDKLSKKIQKLLPEN